MKHIIIVEDDPSISDPMTIMLENAGYGVTTFTDGTSILSNNFELTDMFILDRQIPGVDGLSLCQHLKSQESTKHIPIIMISADINIKTLSADVMADEAIEKPFRMKELTEMVARHLKV